MLARRSTLNHNGRKWELPLLVPSFSSKGTGFRKRMGGRRQYDVAGDLRDFGHRPAKVVLVSAYDLHFRHLDLTDETNHTESALNPLKQAELVFLDSGGYELSAWFDTGEPKVTKHDPRSGYDETAYRKQIKRLCAESNFPGLVLTNFDYSRVLRSVKKQLEAAKRLFGDFPDQMHSFILKPWGKQGVIDLGKLTDKHVEELRAFKIVGVTEKELGADLWDRVTCVARLRQKLNEAKIDAPLHIWGGLDPVITPLYFFAGAQIFDGLSWLRYAYLKGMAINKMSHPVVFDGLEIAEGWKMARGSMTLNNRGMLGKLETALQSWVDFGGQDFSMFHEAVRDELRDAYRTMRTKIKGI